MGINLCIANSMEEIDNALELENVPIRRSCNRLHLAKS